MILIKVTVWAHPGAALAHKQSLIGAPTAHACAPDARSRSTLDIAPNRDIAHYLLLRSIWVELGGRPGLQLCCSVFCRGGSKNKGDARRQTPTVTHKPLFFVYDDGAVPSSLPLHACIDRKYETSHTISNLESVNVSVSIQSYFSSVHDNRADRFSRRIAAARGVEKLE